jgi:hypothetical protein
MSSATPATRIERKIVGHAYPRNGNVYNPTPELSWTAYLEGVRQGTFQTKRDAMGILREECGYTGPVPIVRVVSAYEASRTDLRPNRR